MRKDAKQQRVQGKKGRVRQAALQSDADIFRGIRGSKRSARPVLQTENELAEDEEKERCARAERAQNLKAI